MKLDSGTHYANRFESAPCEKEDEFEQEYMLYAVKIKDIDGKLTLWKNWTSMNEWIDSFSTRFCFAPSPTLKLQIVFIAQSFWWCIAWAMDSVMLAHGFRINTVRNLLFLESFTNQKSVRLSWREIARWSIIYRWKQYAIEWRMQTRQFVIHLRGILDLYYILRWHTHNIHYYTSFLYNDRQSLIFAWMYAIV